MYTRDELEKDVMALITAERASSYKKAELVNLYDMAIAIRRSLDTTTWSETLPVEIFRVFQNIDLGAIKPEYRIWVLNDAETALREFQILLQD